MTKVTTTALTEFLLARIAEDEEAIGRTRRYLAQGDALIVGNVSRDRVLAECEAKRQIVEQHEANRTDLMRETDTHSWEVRVLARVYAVHPDYEERWSI